MGLTPLGEDGAVRKRETGVLGKLTFECILVFSNVFISSDVAVVSQSEMLVTDQATLMERYHGLWMVVTQQTFH